MLDVAASRTRLARFGRWGLIAIVILMAAALIGTTWSTNRSVSDASDTLVRGQAEVFRDAVFAAMPRGVQVTDEALAEVLAEHSEDGLRYVALFRRDGGLTARAGESVLPLDDFDTGARDPAIVDGRARVVFGPRPRGERAERAERAGRAGRTGRRAMRRPGAIVVEFEPRVASELHAAARTTVGVGAVAGIALILFAAALVRWYQLEQARERAAEHERRLASLGQMSAVLAHEIRNPIASLKGNAQLLVKMLPDEGKPRSKAQRVVDESVRLEALTNDLLEFARAGKLDRADANPGALLRDAADSVAGDRIDVDDADAPASWSMDAARMRQVLTNLLDNAAQAGDDRVTASASVSGDALVYTVRDRGPGFDADALEHVFEPFYTRKTRGTGLGLAVSRRIVELHGGTLTASNHPEGGAVLRVELPRT